jgi:peptidyl-prolyl cis-trans isomerase C
MAGQKNNGALIAIAAVVLIALAAGGFYFFQSSGDEEASGSPEMQASADTNESATSQDAAGVETAAGDAQDETSAPNMQTGEFVVEEGNPVVAKVDGKDITRVDVYRFIQTMPPNIQQLPATAVYPMAMEQVINTRLVQNKADAADVTESEEFKREMDIAAQQIARNLYLQEQVNKRISESDLRKAYKEYVAKLPDVEERRASHILLETQAKAQAAIDKLKTGGDFAELAKSLSVGPTAPKGGDLGYFTKQEMVPEFSNAAFSMEEGEISNEPVQTQFGWHVIKLTDIRQKPKPTFEQMAPMIEAEKRREVLDELVKEWREDAKIEQFDINGKPLKDGANVIGIVPENKNQPKQDG